MHQMHNNENNYAWQFKGKAGTKVPSNSGRRRLTILGAIDPLTCDPVTMLLEGTCDREVIKSYLQEVRKWHPCGKKIKMFLDNAPYNRAYDVQEKAVELGIELEYLPPYSPNLNLIERLWKYFKKRIMKNKYYESFELFCETIQSFFFNFKDHLDDLVSLLNPKFEIILAI